MGGRGTPPSGSTNLPPYLARHLFIGFKEILLEVKRISLELKQIFFEPRAAYPEFKVFCFPFMGSFSSFFLRDFVTS